MDLTLIKTKSNISIIIPVYNFEEGLVKCLDSILTQPFSGIFEVIAVDDYSTDNSLMVLNEYKKKEPRLIIIAHDANKKLSCARSTGIRAATGDYVMHVDCDDWLIQNSLQELYDTVISSNVDVMVFNYLHEDKLGNQKRFNGIKKELITSDKTIVAPYFLTTCWNKVVKRNLLDSLVYESVCLNHAEDLIYAFELLNKANSFFLSPRFHLVYYNNSSSITNAAQPKGFLTGQKTILLQLNSIFIKYSTPEWMKNFVLDYFEKWVLLSFARIQFLYVKDINILTSIFEQLSSTHVISDGRLRKLQLAIESKYFNLILVYRGFGLRIPLSILYRSVKQRFIG